jgi:dihydrofolate reductase
MINLIVAIGQNNLIGKDNDLPWHYKEDLKYFKETTTNKTVVMGENTFYSIFNRTNKLLPNRKMVVATFNKDFHQDGVEVIYDLEKYLQETKEDVFIIGGCQIYKVSLKYVDRLYITHVNKEYEGNMFFPEIDYSLYDKISQKDSGDLSFCVYERKK